jgi:hypothetical protein
MAIVNLGSIKFNWKGAYAGGTAYAVDDVVSYNGSSYVCTAASTGNLPTDTNFWDQMSSAGTNGTDGTDISTTLTTQGDILYRDGSGLQRLPKGTANQVLKMNSGATAPEYGTLSSDWVKVASTTVTSAVSGVTFDGLFSSDYDIYKIFINDWNNTNHDWKKMNFRFSNSQYTSSNYDWTGFYHYRNIGTNANASGLEGGMNTSYLPITWWGIGTSDTGIIEVTITNPNSTTRNKCYKFEVGTMDNGSTMHYFDGFGRLDAYSGSAMSGVTFFANGNHNTTSGTFTMYGLKK